MSLDSQSSHTSATRTPIPFETLTELHGSRFTLKEWVILDAVAQCGSYSDAAKTLQISQPSISYAMAKLEGEVGVQLFRLEGRKSRLTDAGTAMLEQARILLREAHALKTMAESLHVKWRPPLNLVVEKSFPSSLLFAVLRRYAENSLNPPVHVVETPTNDIERTVEHYSAEITVSRKTTGTSSGEPLILVKHVPVASPNHLLCKEGKALRIDDIEKEVQVVSKNDDVCLPGNLSKENGRRWELDDYLTVQKALQAGVGYGWLPEHQVKELLDQGTLKMLSIIDCPAFTTKFYVSHRKVIPPAGVAALISQLQYEAQHYRH
jgi:DNA-binding transcriptional LysR family regulator